MGSFCLKSLIMRTSSFAKIILLLLLPLLASVVQAQSKADSMAIKTIIQDEDLAWNKGDAEAYSRQFAADGTFTNIMGLFFVGHKLFVERHDQIFKGVFNKTTLQQKIVSFKFVRPDVALVETLSTVSGFLAGPPPGASLDAKGHLHTRLLQVLAKEAGDWKIVSYHNVDLKPGIPVTE